MFCQRNLETCLICISVKNSPKYPVMRYTASDSTLQHPVWMSPEEMVEPGELLREFCRSWDLADCRFYLWQMLSNSISSNNPRIEATHGDQLYFFENLMAMIEAVYLTNQPSAATVDQQIEERGKIDNPIKSGLAAFFDTYTPEQFSVRWRLILEAYSARDYYRQSSPSDVLYAIEKLSDLIQVAHEIYRQLPGEGFPDEAPEAMPAIGSAHLAIRRFFEARSLEEWDRCLRHVLFFALSTDDPDEGGCKEDTLGLYNMVCGLVEGCWVVDGLPGAYVSC